MNMRNAEEAFTPTHTSEIVLNLVATSGFSKRSLIGLVRNAFDEIEAAHQNGFSYKTIEAELNKYGIPIKAGSLKSILRRIRNSKSEQAKKILREPQRKLTTAPLRSATNAADVKVFTRNTDRKPSELF